VSGEKYEIFMAGSAYRKYKKFPPNLKEKIKEESEIIGNDPYACEELKGPLRGVRSYHFVQNSIEYRIAYRILEDKKEIEIVLVKSRESFYQTLRRVINR
jgi:mRNA-degrading endonuclease RelE of RelBE toxin-antitoxin system